MTIHVGGHDQGRSRFFNDRKAVFRTQGTRGKNTNNSKGMALYYFTNSDPSITIFIQSLKMTL